MSEDAPRDFRAPFSAVFEYPTRVRIFGVVLDADEPMHVAEIIQQADVSKSTFYNHCDALVDLGLLESEEHSKRVEYEVADTELAEVFLEANRLLGERLRETDTDRLENLVDEMYS